VNREPQEWRKMNKKNNLSRGRRLFASITISLLLFSILTIKLSPNIPLASAGSSLNHTNGNVRIKYLTDFGRILQSLDWGQSQIARDGLGFGYIGLVIDQDNYNHTPGGVDIADSFDKFPYGGTDDFENVDSITMVIDDGTTQKSMCSFKNTGLGTGDPDDILINQTVWTITGKDWVVLQWSVDNIKTPATPITDLCFGLEIPCSKDGARYGVGGDLVDGGDDVDGFDAINNVYWVEDTDSGVSMGVCSVTPLDPITHYYAEDYHSDYSTEYKDFFGNDTWLYQRLHAPNGTATDGINPGNITATIGWSGETIDIGKVRTFTMVIAINDSFDIQ
jgi:hypothetical protein